MIRDLLVDTGQLIKVVGPIGCETWHMLANLYVSDISIDAARKTLIILWQYRECAISRKEIMQLWLYKYNIGLSDNSDYSLYLAYTSIKTN